MVRFTCSLALIACLTAPALADLPPPPPVAGLKRVPYEIVMKLEKEIPGYKFYTFSRMGLGGLETINDELTLGTENAVAVPSSSSASVRTGVVAVPEQVMDELETKENLAKRLSQEAGDDLPAGVVIYETYGTSADLNESDPRTKVENVVTISPDEKAGVNFTAKETPAPPSPNTADNEKQDTVANGAKSSTRSPVTLVIAGIAGALAIITLGIWCFRGK